MSVDRAWWWAHRGRVRLRRIGCLCVVLLGAASFDPTWATEATAPTDGAQAPAGTTSTKPQRARGIGGLLDAPAPVEPAAPGAVAAPAPVQPSEPSIGETLRTLRARYEAARRATIDSVTPLASISDVEARAAALRVRVDGVRADLDVRDPSAESSVAAEVRELASRWGDLARAIVDGELPGQPVAAVRWDGYAAAMSRLHCDDARVPHHAPAGGMPLVGWAWACLSDVYFHEVASAQVSLARWREHERAERTQRLAERMAAAEERIDGARATFTEHPSPGLLLRELTWQLHQVRLELMRLRIRELEGEQAAVEKAPELRWLDEATRVRVSSAAAHAHPVEAPVGATVVARAGSARTAASVVDAPLPRLARELRDVHERLETLRERTTDPLDAERQRLETNRARILGDLAAHAR